MQVRGYGHVGTWVQHMGALGVYGVRYVGSIRWVQTYTVLGDVTCVHLYSTSRLWGASGYDGA